MEITEIRVKLMHNRTDRLRAFCSITIDDDFVVHDLRVIEGRKGLFVAMPSRKLTDNCPKCGSKNDLRSKYCAECGQKLAEKRGPAGGGRDKLHVDVAHPINTPCREELQEKVLTAYREEDERSRDGLPPLNEYEADGSSYDDGDYEGPEEAEAPDEGAEEPVEEQVDIPSLEAEPSAAPEDGAPPPSDLAPVVESVPEEPSPGRFEEPPEELGEVTPQGESVMPSEPLDEAPAAEGDEEAEAGDLPEGPAGLRRARRQERRKGGFGEGIL